MTGGGPPAVDFALDGPLPQGTLVLEASAGTGKTYTIAGLAARYVAEGVGLEKLLLITFTRMATSELRERVRQRLREVLDGLRGAPTDDVVVALLARGDRARAVENLERALADFDAATIATTHGFCDEMLGSLGIAADVDPDRTFVEDVRDLRSDVVDDLFVRGVAGGSRRRPPRYEQAKEIARIAIDNPETDLAAATTEMGATRRDVAAWTRAELRRRRERMKLVTYDDLQDRLRDALARSPAAVARLRDRFEVVLVDEFQDTDPVQWQILEAAFADRTLVLIGDPKQAIYAFRGADVFAYLDAAERSPRQTLNRNHRSDQRLIDAYDQLFAGARLGHAQIGYIDVTAAHDRPRLIGTPVDAALRIRMALRRNMPDRSDFGWVRAAEGREYIARDLAADVVRTLGCETARIERDQGAPTRVQPSDIAVLVRTNRHAALVREALEAVGVPAVINGAGSVFGGGPAREWLTLLAALERPSHQGRARAAALTCFFGWSAARAAAAGDGEWDRQVHDRLHEWAQVLRTRGVASLTEAITLDQGLFARVLSEVGGERALTDLRHIGQLLHAAAAEEGLGLTALTSWLRRRIAEAEDDLSNEERSRRLESDAAAVQVLTVHRSKGLEFGIVYLPFAWNPVWRRDQSPPVMFHDDHGDRVLDVTLEGTAYDDHRARWQREERGEDLRLLYVALTRARHQAVVWWAGSRDACASSLGRLLFGRGDDGAVADVLPQTPFDKEAAAELVRLRDRAGGAIALERALVPDPPPTYARPAPAARELERARWTRTLDDSWRRTSYSALTAAAHETPVGSEPELGADSTDEPDAGAAPPAGPWADVPVGTRVGTIVHRALEQADFAAPAFGPEVDELCAAEGLRAALTSPLGDAFDGLRLADLGRADRLDELEFELPLGGAGVDRLAAVLRAHGDPYGERLAELGRERLNGYLTGSLDLVARLPDGRFAVFDYKTNGLESFAPAALAAEMERRHYGLQALLYVVALHRYLGWRLPGYDPAAHLAGAGYLFLRGMPGEGGRGGEGVHAWRPAHGLIKETSDLLDG